MTIESDHAKALAFWREVIDGLAPHIKPHFMDTMRVIVAEYDAEKEPPPPPTEAVLREQLVSLRARLPELMLGKNCGTPAGLDELRKARHEIALITSRLARDFNGDPWD